MASEYHLGRKVDARDPEGSRKRITAEYAQYEDRLQRQRIMEAGMPSAKSALALAEGVNFPRPPATGPIDQTPATIASLLQLMQSGALTVPNLVQLLSQQAGNKYS